jgi:nucleoside-diphosphate-sugar epimerase
MSELKFENSVICVIGGAGFVGSNLVHQLLNESPKQIVVIDNLLSSDTANIPADPRVKFVFGSVTDAKVLSSIPQDVNYVFHLACYHGNQSSIADPFADHDNNTYTSLCLFDHLKTASSLKKVVYAAAACAVAEKTYDAPTATTEDQPISLFHDSPYSISKLIGELYGNYYQLRYNLPFVRARFSNVFGPREILGAGRWRGTVHTVWRNVTPTFIWKALHQEALPLDNGGNASRDFIFVEDMARGLMACALHGNSGEAYNLATGRETSILELATWINELAGNSTPPDIKPARDWDRSGKRFASTDKAKTQLGFEAQVSVRDGLAKTVAWTVANRELIARTMQQHAKMMDQHSAGLSAAYLPRQ